MTDGAQRSATQRVALNTTVQTVGRGVVMVIGALSVGILTRYLGAAQYGELSLIFVYLQLFATVADMGLFTIAVREMSRDESRIQEIVGNTLSLRSLLSVVIMLVAILVAWLLPFTPSVQIGIVIAAFSQIFGLLNSSLVTVFQTKLRMDYATLADIVGRLVAFAATVAVVMADGGFYAVVATSAFGSLVCLLVSLWFSRRYVKFRFYRDTKLWKKMFRESLPLGAAIVVGSLYFRVDLLLISFFRSAVEVGVYGVIYKVLDIVNALPMFFTNAVFPIMIKRLDESNEAGHVLLQKAFEALIILGVGIASGGLVTAPFVMRLIGGEEFVFGADALRISLFAMVLTFLSLFFGSLYVAKNKQMFSFKLGMFGLVLNTVLNVVFIPLYGLTGAATVTLVTEIIIVIIFARGIPKLLGTNVSLAPLGKIAAAGGLMVLAMLPLAHWPVIAGIVGSVVYVALLFVFKIIREDVIKELRPR